VITKLVQTLFPILRYKKINGTIDELGDRNKGQNPLLPPNTNGVLCFNFSEVQMCLGLKLFQKSNYKFAYKWNRFYESTNFILLTFVIINETNQICVHMWFAHTVYGWQNFDEMYEYLQNSINVINMLLFSYA